MPQNSFSPKPGQIDYTNGRYVPVINCVVRYKNTILLLKRSADMNYYPNCWNGVSGFLDDAMTVQEKTREELSEELGYTDDDIASITQIGLFEYDEPLYTKTWIVHAMLVEVTSDKITTDWEAQDHAWVPLDEAQRFQLMPGFDCVLECVKH